MEVKDWVILALSCVAGAITAAIFAYFAPDLASVRNNRKFTGRAKKEYLIIKRLANDQNYASLYFFGRITTQISLYSLKIMLITMFMGAAVAERNSSLSNFELSSGKYFINFIAFTVFISGTQAVFFRKKTGDYVNSAISFSDYEAKMKKKWGSEVAE